MSPVSLCSAPRDFVRVRPATKAFSAASLGDVVAGGEVSLEALVARGAYADVDQPVAYSTTRFMIVPAARVVLASTPLMSATSASGMTDG
jgi:hypothetical protein